MVGRPITALINDGGPAVDALKLLEEDHRLVKQILAEGESTTERGEKTRAELFARLKRELTIHEQMEEEVLYPALREISKSRDIALEGYEEHHVVDEIFSELEQTPPSDDTWGAKFKVAKENLEHHIEEEETEMWAAARREFTEDELEQMGRRMLEIKQAAKELLPR
jgi:hemerythrin superfamily protein